MPDNSTPPQEVIEINRALLVQEIGVTDRWWRRHWRELHRDGVLSKRGRLSFGRVADVRTWLTGGRR